MTHVAFLAVGGFGANVLRVVAATGLFTVQALKPGQVVLPATTVLLTAGTTPLPKLRREVESACPGGMTPWLPLTVLPSQVRCGPWLGPGLCCVDCFEARAEQHDASSGRSAAARAASTNVDGELWPWLPVHARVAAGLLTTATMRFSAGGGTSRDVTALRSVCHHRFDRVAVTRHDVIPLSGCRSCRGGADTLVDGRRQVLAAVARGLGKG